MLTHISYTLLILSGGLISRTNKKQTKIISNAALDVRRHLSKHRLAKWRALRPGPCLPGKTTRIRRVAVRGTGVSRHHGGPIQAPSEYPRAITALS